MSIILIILFALGYLYYSVKIFHNHLIANVETIYTDEAKQLGTNISRYLLNNFGPHLKEKLQNDPQLRKELEKSFRLLLVRPFKYIYILYADEKGHFRYLIDTTVDPQERGAFKEPFALTDSRWSEIYRSGKPRMLLEKNLQSIWGTYLYPIRSDGRTEAMIVIDFASKFPTHIRKIVQPVYETFRITFMLLFIFILLIILQMLNNYRIRKAAMQDPLTGAYNRQFLRKLLQSINPTKYSLLMVDIDHFKKINDTYGHKIGDEVLQHVTEAISKSIRPDDFLIRYGGEEFLILVKKTRYTSIKEVAERIRRDVENSIFTHKKLHIQVTVSIGVVDRIETYKKVSDAVKRADEMLYSAKRSGRNMVVVDSDGLHHKSRQSQISVERIRDALDEDRIVCYYQPIFDLQTGKIVRYEALLRIIDEKGEMLLPFRFLPGILHTSLYADLTKRVIQLVMKTIEDKGIACTLNLNVSDLMDNTIYKNLLKELKKKERLCEYLTIELLEYEAIDENEIKSRFDEIRKLGVHVAIDDFGSGFANFSLFQKLSVDLLKIDGKIIQEVATSKVAYNIAKNINNFAKDLEIPTIAEFVHDEATLRIIRELGIRYAQGNYLAEPRPLKD